MRFLRLIVLCALCLVPALTGAQEDEDSGGFLQRTIEDALSGAGREVNIVGFRGALSSSAQLDQLTIADDEGVWLTLNDAQLDWRRAALLRGRLELDRLTVASVELVRLPATEAPPPEPEGGFRLPALPAPEAVQFSLPELPVSVQIGELRIDSLTMDSSVLGQEVVFGLSGSARLAEGEGDVDLDAARIDDVQGVFDVSGSFVNQTEVLSIELRISEAEDGLVTTLLNVPDRPSVELSVLGEGPLSDFSADLSLKTAGEDRLTGAVAFGGVADASGAVRQNFSADLSGDITPLLQPEYREFVGPDLVLEVAGGRAEEGGLDIETLRLVAAELNLNGRISLDPDGWPKRIDVRGGVSPVASETVLLPIPGAQTRLGAASIDLTYDHALNDGWLLSVTTDALTRDEFALGALRLGGQGTLAPGEGDLVGQANGSLSLELADLDLGDPELTAAVGERLTAVLDFDLKEDAPFRITELRAAGADYDLSGDITLRLPEGSNSPLVEHDLTLTAERLGRFASLAGQDLSGAVNVRVAGDVVPLDGAFDVVVDGATENLSIGVEQIDPLIAGTGTIAVAARRDNAGTFLDALSVETDQTNISGTLALSSGDVSGEIRAQILDTSLMNPNMSGDAAFQATFDVEGSVANADVSLRAPGPINAQIAVSTSTGDSPSPTEFDAMVAVDDLSLYAWAVGLPIEGRVGLSADGTVDLASGAASVRVDGSASQIKTGIEQADAFLAGTLDLLLDAQRLDDGSISVAALSLDGDQLTANVRNASFAAEGNKINGELDLRTPGPTTAQITLSTPTGSTAPTAFDALVSAEDLSAFAWLVGLPLEGQVNVTASGNVDIESGAVAVRVDGAVDQVQTGIEQADALLEGSVALALDVQRQSDGAINIDVLNIDGAQIKATASGDIGDTGTELQYALSLPNLAVLAPDLPGELSSSGRVAAFGEVYEIDSTLSGPGGLEAALEGNVQTDMSAANIRATGQAPLALANASLAPNILEGLLAFDLAIDGPLELNSVSGTVSTSGSRMSIAAVRVSLDRIDSQIDISGGAAQIDTTVVPSTGGEVRVSGPVTLSAPFPGDLSINIANVGIVQAGLLQTAINGTLSMAGPLTGGADISGEILFDEVSVQVPSTSGAASAAIPNLVHAGESTAVRQTRIYAGLIETVQDTAAGPSAPPFGLDILFSAPSRIFIRGRGLDAEMGGELRLQGTTENIVPSGRFELIRGRLNILGQRIDLTEGYIEPQGDLDPYLQIIAEADGGDIQIQVVIEGALSDIELTLTSSPELPEDEILSRFLFGRDATQISPFQALQIADGLSQLRGGAGVFGSVRRGLGVDDLDVTSGGLTAGQYLSENIYTDISRSTDGETEINLNLDITPNLTARGTARTDDTSGLGLFLEKDY